MAFTHEQVKQQLDSHFIALRDNMPRDDPRRTIVEAYFNNVENITFMVQLRDGNVYIYNP